MLCDLGEVEQPISYATHAGTFKKALTAANIQSSKITHVCRITAAQQAEAGNSDLDQTSRLAGWVADSKNACYTTNIPMQTLRILAGWAKDGHSFWLPRAALEPPVELTSQIFAFADVQLAAIRATPHVLNIAGPKFLDLLQVRVCDTSVSRFFEKSWILIVF